MGKKESLQKLGVQAKKKSKMNEIKEEVEKLKVVDNRCEKKVAKVKVVAKPKVNGKMKKKKDNVKNNEKLKKVGFV